MKSLICRIFGICTHERYSWPLTLHGKTSVTCLDCGASAAYDWQRMTVYDPAAL